MEMGEVHEEGLILPDSVPPIVNMNGHFNYHAGQQVFFVNGPADMLRKGMKGCMSYLQRDDYVVTLGMGAHKLHKRRMKWNQARKSCMEEGGDANYLYTWVLKFFTWMKKRKWGKV